MESNWTLTSPADIGEIVDSSAFSAFQKMLVFLGFLLLGLGSINLTIMSFAVPAMAVDWRLSTAAFTPAFAAGLIGMLAGSTLLGWLADLVGRRWMIIICVAIFGVFTIATPLAHSINGLLMYRFLTGIGLGGVIPNVMAASAECAPGRLRALVVVIVSCGLPTGSVVAGTIAVFSLHFYGWKSIFYISGIFSVLLVPVLMGVFPESIRFLALKRANSADLRKIVGKIVTRQQVPDNCRFVIREPKMEGSPVRGLFTDRLATTGLLWVTFLVSYMVLFLMITWLPTLLHQAGIPLQRAIVASASFFFGGVAGGLGLSALAARFDPRRVVAAGYLGAFLSMAPLGLTDSRPVVLMINLFVAGVFVIGAQLTLYAVAAASYPTAMRSTGLGWAVGAGGVGSIVGPVVAGLLLSRGMPIPALYVVSAAPGLVGALAAFLLSFTRPGEVAHPVPAIE